MPSKAKEDFDRQDEEVENRKAFREERFRKLLGAAWPMDDIISLVESNVDYHDLEGLLNKGCPKKTAVQILL